MLLFSVRLSVSYTEVWNRVCIMSSIDWYLAFADYTYSNTIHSFLWSCYGSPVVRFIRRSVSLSVGILVRVSQVNLLKTFKTGFLNAFKTESWFCDSNAHEGLQWTVLVGVLVFGMESQYGCPVCLYVCPSIHLYVCLSFFSYFSKKRFRDYKYLFV